MHNNGGIYAIYDKAANQIAGQIQLHIFRHTAAAIRFFGDVASDPNGLVAKHIDDYELHHLGNITLDNRIEPTDPQDQLIITGTLWKQSQLDPTDIPTHRSELKAV